MIPVDQVVIGEGRGDCCAAALASMLEVPLTAVPNFSDAPEGLYHSLYRGVLYGYGWMLCDNAHPDGVSLWHDKSLRDCYMACVSSRNIEGVSHAVVGNKDGLVVHDPSPNKNYQDENIFETNQCNYFETYVERADDQWQCFYQNYVRAKMRKTAEELENAVDGWSGKEDQS